MFGVWCSMFVVWRLLIVVGCSVLFVVVVCCLLLVVVCCFVFHMCSSLSCNWFCLWFVVAGGL